MIGFLDRPIYTEAMTVCIAAISDDKDILSLTDKKFTVTHGVVSAYEITENKKSIECTSSCVALFAGDITNANSVLQLAMGKIQDSDTIEDVAKKIQQAYNEKLQDEINQQVLSKHGLNIQAFNEQQRTLDATFVSSVLETISTKGSLGIEVIIAGKDDETPRLIKMQSTGALEDDTYAGYVCIGSGSSHAKLSLIESGCHGAMPLELLVYAMLKAKKYAEFDPNVGKMSDIMMASDKIQRFDEDVVKILWSEYDESVNKIAEITQKTSTIMKGHIDGITSK